MSYTIIARRKEAPERVGALQMPAGTTTEVRVVATEAAFVLTMAAVLIAGGFDELEVSCG